MKMHSNLMERTVYHPEILNFEPYLATGGNFGLSSLGEGDCALCFERRIWVFKSKESIPKEF